MRLDDGVLSPEDSDLAQLRSLNDTELSADWYNFQVICFENIVLTHIRSRVVTSYQDSLYNNITWDNNQLLSAAHKNTATWRFPVLVSVVCLKKQLLLF